MRDREHPGKSHGDDDSQHEQRVAEQRSRGVTAELRENGTELRPEQDEQNGAEDERQDVREDQRLQPHFRTKDALRPPAEINAARDGRENAGDVQPLRGKIGDTRQGGAFLLALTLAATGLTHTGRRTHRLLRPAAATLKAWHSGIVGDYITWMTVGIALYGGIWALILR